MGKFTKTVNTNGVFKGMILENGEFIDTETGEIVPVIDIIEEAMNGMSFDIKVSNKSEIDLDVEV